MEIKRVLKAVGIIFLSIFGVLLLLTIGAVYFFRGSNSTNSDRSEQFLNEKSLVAPNLEAMPDYSFPPTLDRSTSSGTNLEANTEERNIIKEATIQLVVDDIDKSVEEVNALKEKYKAEVVESTDSGEGIDRVVKLTLKVDESNLEKIFPDLKNIDSEKESSSVRTSDVTDVVLDLNARLNTYKSTEAQLLEILKKSTSVVDTMAVYKELTNIRYQIESVESQIKYYANRTTFSTIRVTISQSSSGIYLDDAKWRPVGVFNDALRALVEFAQFIGSVFIWVVVFGIPIVIVVYIVKYIVRKAKK